MRRRLDWFDALALALLQLAAWFAVVVPRGPWSGSWRKMIDQASGSVIIVGPTLAALVALVYARRRRTSLPDLVVGSPHVARDWFGPAVRVWLLAVTSTVVVVGVMAVVARAQGVPLLVDPLRVLPYAALVLAAHALVGMVVGLHLDPRHAVPVAGVVSFGLFLLAVAQLAPVAFVTGGVSGPVVGSRYRLEAIVQLGAIAAFTVIALGALAMWPSRGFRLRAGVVSAGVVAAMVVSGNPLAVDERFEPADVSYRCAGDDPEVCVLAEAPRSLSQVAQRMHTLSRPLRELSLVLPHRWVQADPAHPSEGGLLTFFDGDELRAHVPDQTVVAALSRPGDCSGFAAEVPGPWIDALPALARWIRVRNGLPVAFPRDATASDAWVRATYPRLVACDLDAITPP